MFEFNTSTLLEKALEVLPSHFKFEQFFCFLFFLGLQPLKNFNWSILEHLDPSVEADMFQNFNYLSPQILKLETRHNFCWMIRAGRNIKKRLSLRPGLQSWTKEGLEISSISNTNVSQSLTLILQNTLKKESKMYLLICSS